MANSSAKTSPTCWVSIVLHSSNNSSSAKSAAACKELEKDEEVNHSFHSHVDCLSLHIELDKNNFYFPFMDCCGLIEIKITIDGNRQCSCKKMVAQPTYLLEDFIAQHKLATISVIAHSFVQGKNTLSWLGNLKDHPLQS